ncbi:MAG: transcriptional regulator [Cohnella sp.]|jgi:predicted transcriptional regulator|uniref:ArsR/SmtB family transcription factor n=1 Tax=Cohnella sp. TaxID=1883426 RepID=UPI000E3A72B1|nr:helix-turn-helix domain-containing protein [Cohnella sp.]REK64345.1 MAG: transcriptional regulator [Cohnella sp.]
MIRANTDRKWLPVYEALANGARLRILELLAERPMNLKDLAQALDLSGPMMTMHIRKLEQAGLIRTRMVRKDGGTHKMCSLAEDGVEIAFPSREKEARPVQEVSVPIGHYTRYEVYPTCGLATKDQVIGQYDDARYFLEPERMSAQILWFGKGFVEYQIPNYLLTGQKAEEIEISLEIGSEAPGVNKHWPSDIHFYLNGVLLGVWTSPGDSGEGRGKLTPDWWPDHINQYGWLKMIRVRRDGTYVDGQRVSDVTIADIPAARNHWTLRLAVPEDAEHVGGLTIYGESFGNYAQDILFRVYT